MAGLARPWTPAFISLLAVIGSCEEGFTCVANTGECSGVDEQNHDSLDDTSFLQTARVFEKRLEAKSTSHAQSKSGGMDRHTATAPDPTWQNHLHMNPIPMLETILALQDKLSQDAHVSPGMFLLFAAVGLCLLCAIGYQMISLGSQLSTALPTKQAQHGGDVSPGNKKAGQPSGCCCGSCVVPGVAPKVEVSLEGRWLMSKVEGDIDAFLQETGIGLVSRSFLQALNHGVNTQGLELRIRGNIVDFDLSGVSPVQYSWALDGEWQAFVGANGPASVKPAWGPDGISLFVECADVNGQNPYTSTFTCSSPSELIEASTSPSGRRAEFHYQRRSH